MFEMTEELAAVNYSDYSSEGFVHAGKYMLGKTRDEMGQIGRCCNQWLSKGENVGFWKRMQDKVCEINSELKMVISRRVMSAKNDHVVDLVTFSFDSLMAVVCWISILL